MNNIPNVTISPIVVETVEIKSIEIQGPRGPAGPPGSAADFPTNISYFVNDVPYLVAADIPPYLTPYLKIVDYTAPVNADWSVSAGLANILNKPTALSQFSNDMGFLTLATLPPYPVVPSNISAFSNDAGYITASSTSTLTNKSGNISQWSNNAGYITASSTDTLTNKSGNISQWTNNSGYITNVITALGYTPENVANKGANNGYAPLDATGKVPSANLPTSGGAVTGVSNSDGTLTISPTTGAVVSSLNLAHANTWTALQTIDFDNIQATSTDAFLIVNNSNSPGSPAAQWSPRIRFKGSAYKSAATAASQSAEVVQELQTFTGASVITGKLTWSSNIAGAGYNVMATLSDTGNFQANGNFIESSTSLRVGIGTAFNTTKSTVVGQNATSQGINSTVLGSNSNVGQNGVTIGNDNFTSATTVNNVIMISTSATNTKTSAQNAIVIAPVYTAANGEGGVYIGRDVNVTSAAATNTSTNQGVYIGKGVTHTSGASAAGVIIGRNNNGQDGTSPVLIGSGITTAAGLQNSVVVGAAAITQDGQTNTVVIGTAAKAYLDGTYGSTGNAQVAIGETAFAGSWRAVAIGGHAQALAVSSNAIGYGAYTRSSHGSAFGRGAYIDKANTQVFYTGLGGGDWWFGGVAAAWNNPAMPGGEVIDNSAALTAESVISKIHGISGRDANATPTLTNIKGGILRLLGGCSTGTANGGHLELGVTLPGGASNNTENAETVCWHMFGGTGNIAIQKGGTFTDSVCAIVQYTSTTQGILLPRMTKAQRNAIASQVAGLAVYQTDNTPGLRVYNGTNWMRYTETAD